MLSKSISTVINRLPHWWLSVWLSHWLPIRLLSIRLPIGWLHGLHWNRLTVGHRLRVVSRDDDGGSLVMIVVVHCCHLCLKLLLLLLTIAIAGDRNDEDNTEYSANNCSRDCSSACFGLIVIPAIVLISRTKSRWITAVVVAILIVAVWVVPHLIIKIIINFCILLRNFSSIKRFGRTLLHENIV